MQTYAFRLKRGQDIRQEIQKFAKINNIKAGVVICGVGNLEKAILRMADASIIKVWEGTYEIVSITGTVEANDCHLHIAISDSEGKTFGGHLKNGSIVGITAEIIIQTIDGLEFKRVLDDTGYECLVVKEN